MRTGIVVVITALVGVSACSSDTPAAPKVPSFSTSAPPSSSPAGDRAFPKTCGGVAPLGEVVDILQVAVTGQTVPIVGVPEPKIGRTARIDCYYGVPAGADRNAAPVSIGVASYTDETAARKRMNSTIADEKETGAKANDVPVGSDRGVLLNGKKRTLVAVRGNQTVVVSVILELVPEEHAGALIGRLADRALTPR